ncbi:MAG: tRNA uridine(34) 5-carboxymethylaminomethyl modification radical SAM/GNAT enzyme Elp3 [Methanobacteriota archaeon]|nr:MAG: tRNA uridine(34) 5-carboxymethylaminomethyl modification radical SAM/GNAT enzyme Elp3 [Euryarchaeota archaeon]
MIASQPFLEEIWERLARGQVRGKADLQRAKSELVRRHRLQGIPPDSEILAASPPGMREAFADLLRVKPTRSASGVAVVSVMTPPRACPHGTCVFCPGGPRLGTPQSYTGDEPAARRGARHRYDPRAQTVARLDQLRRTGHATDKIDLIILGGTFSALDPAFRESFVKECLDGLNGSEAGTLDEAQTRNETAPSRCIGLTIETKPDCFVGPEVKECLRLGVTRVELGVQTTHDDVLRLANRGHTDADTRTATRHAKDAGLKVCYHMMPGLPGTDADRDLDSFRAIFENPDYRPDMLKVYPTLVVEGTGLHTMWALGRYRPLTTEAAADLVARMKELVPPWVRIQRIQREIGADAILGGPTKGDLRVRAQERLRAEGKRCHCIRCREIGLGQKRLAMEDAEFHRLEYDASGGREVFLSFEDRAREALVAYARLRVCDAGTFLRELKVFGRVVPISVEPGDRWQHRGLGARLLAECERIAEEQGRPEILVTSGVGVRGYYRRFGYRRSGPYMAKPLS